MPAVCLQQVLDASSARVQRWTLVFPASNTCKWLTAVLKCRFCFAHLFLRFIASLACCKPNACCPPLCSDFAPCFASFFTLCPVFCIFALFFCSSAWFSRTTLHRFPLLASFSTPCFIFLYFRIVYPHLFYFIACKSLVLLGFPAVLFYRLHPHIGP